MKKWKYANKKKKNDFSEYLKLERDRKYSIKVNMPEIVKKAVDGSNKSVFIGTVVEVDGTPTEKLLIIKNYSNVEYLKKRIRNKKQLDIKITRKYDEDNMETYFEFN